MSRVLTGDKLVESIRTRAMIPNDTSVYTDQDILDTVNEEMDVQLLQKLISLREEHLTAHVDIPKNEKGVYDLPIRSVGNKLRDASLLLGDGNSVRELHQISIGELPDYQFGSDSVGRDLFYLKNNQLNLVSKESEHDKIRMYFYLRPSVITKVERAGVITNISVNASSITLTLAKLPKNIKISDSNGIPNKFDIVGSNTPNKIKSFDINPVSINTTLKTVTLDNSDGSIEADEIVIGDYLSLSEESPVPNIPTEMHPYLAQLAAVKILESLGDTEALSNANRRLTKMETSIMQLMDDRVELALLKIKPRHGTITQGIQNRRSYKNRRGQ